jgi:transposase InsO family protein
VARQTVHKWIRRYARSGFASLADKSCKPGSCPHQMAPPIEARVVSLRRDHPGWGPRRIGYQLAAEGVAPVPSRSGIYRALVRHGLIEPHKRRRTPADYRRWERSRSMELWQMDVVGGVKIEGGPDVSVVTGIDDHSRFCVSAKVVARATARPVCDALTEALRRHGVPEGILTDNGKVFTGRYGPGAGPVLFDRICSENGVRHLLTAPYSPTTTGKVERFHKTLRSECLRGRVFASIDQAQAAIDAWVVVYNTERPHQGIGMRPPIDRFRLAETAVVVLEPDDGLPEPPTPPVIVDPSLGVGRWVDQAGAIRIGGFKYSAGRWLAGELVQAVCAGGLVHISHKGVVVRTHAQRLRPGSQPTLRPNPKVRQARGPTAGMSVIRIADGSGNVSFAGTSYTAGRAHRGRPVQVTLVGATVQLSVDGTVVRVHAARHDPAKEHGAFSTPKGRPRKRPHESDALRITGVAQVPEPDCRTGTGT